MKLKICGLSNKIEVETCVKGNVEYCGFILNYTKSHRFISHSQVKLLTEIEKNTSYVGVLVEPSEKELEIFSKLNLTTSNIWQLY